MVFKKKRKIEKKIEKPKTRRKKRENIYRKITSYTPRRYRERMTQELIYAGFEKTAFKTFIGFSILFSIFLGVAIAFDFYLFFGLLGVLLGLIIGLTFFVITNVAIILIADSRASAIEVVLPDVLQLISANIRAGMTIDKAIWLSARPEFGILEDEIRRVGAKTVAGKPIKDALREMTGRVKSKLLERAVKLIVEGIESGGELAKLLQEISLNIRTTQGLRREIASSVLMYTMFIVFAAVLGAPMLLAISLYFVEVMQRLWGPQILTAAETFGEGGGPGSIIRPTGMQISPTELFYFAVVTIAVTTFFGSLIIGLIQHGKEKMGVKYIPMLMLGALGVFFVAKFAITYVFSGFFPV